MEEQMALNPNQRQHQHRDLYGGQNAGYAMLSLSLSVSRFLPGDSWSSFVLSF